MKFRLLVEIELLESDGWKWLAETDRVNTEGWVLDSFRLLAESFKGSVSSVRLLSDSEKTDQQISDGGQR